MSREAIFTLTLLTVGMIARLWNVVTLDLIFLRMPAGLMAGGVLFDLLVCTVAVAVIPYFWPFRPL
jgi:hypothetical protein